MGNPLGKKGGRERKRKEERNQYLQGNEGFSLSPFQQPLHLNNTHRLIPLFHPFNFEERKERDEKR